MTFQRYIPTFLLLFLLFYAQTRGEIDNDLEGVSKQYHFRGTHYIASYENCNYEALSSIEDLKNTMIEATKRCGANLLDWTSYTFPPDGFTMVLLLSESHASIHTYPEFNACFVDLFTCGTGCSHEVFEEVLKEYLQPGEIKRHILYR